MTDQDHLINTTGNPTKWITDLPTALARFQAIVDPLTHQSSTDDKIQTLRALRTYRATLPPITATTPHAEQWIKLMNLITTTQKTLRQTLTHEALQSIHERTASLEALITQIEATSTPQSSIS